jgi:VanZ family protein
MNGWQRTFCFGAWLLAIGAVIAGSLSPDLRPPSGGVIDKFQHVGAYLVLSGLAMAAFVDPRRRILALVFLFLLGGAIELAQGYFGGREASVFDQLANTLGILLGAAAFTWTLRLRRSAF